MQERKIVYDESFSTYGNQTEIQNLNGILEQECM